MPKKRHTLTAKEYSIMKVLWNAERPMMASEITEIADIAENSVLPMIKALINKGYIKIAGNLKVAKTSSRLLVPKISLSEHIAWQIGEAFDENKKTANMASVLSHFAKHNKYISEEELITELENYIEEVKNRNPS